MCKDAVFTIYNCFYENITLYNKVDILDALMLMLKTYTLRSDLICEKTLNIIGYVSQNNAMKKRISERDNFLTILFAVKSCLNIESVGRTFCVIIENLIENCKKQTNKSHCN